MHTVHTYVGRLDMFDRSNYGNQISRCGSRLSKPRSWRSLLDAGCLLGSRSVDVETQHLCRALGMLGMHKKRDGPGWGPDGMITTDG
jgi:hypothetical protein